jgi:hypothetical protein
MYYNPIGSSLPVLFTLPQSSSNLSILRCITSTSHYSLAYLAFLLYNFTLKPFGFHFREDTKYYEEDHSCRSQSKPILVLFFGYSRIYFIYVFIINIFDMFKYMYNI